MILLITTDSEANHSKLTNSIRILTKAFNKFNKNNAFYFVSQTPDKIVMHIFRFFNSIQMITSL